MLAMCLCESFFSGVFCEMLTGGEKQSATVLAVCEAIRDGIAACFMDKTAVNGGTHDELMDGLGRVKTVVCGFAALLDPVSGSVEDVLHMKNSSSSMDMEVTVKNILSGGNFYSRLMDDLVKKGASNQVAKPILDGLVQQYLASDEVSTDTLRESAKNLPQLRQKMRTKATTQLEDLMLKALMRHGNDIINASTDASQVSPSMLCACVDGLQLFLDKKGVPELLHKLETFRGTCKVELGLAHLKEGLEKFKIAEDAGDDAFRALDFTSITSTIDELGGIPNELPDDVRQQCASVMRPLLRHFKLK
ncbi:unnamed protein product, partial [Symbiodinium sp. CCMP2456]